MRNLISRRVGVDDHFPINKYSRAMFPENDVYTDIVKTSNNEYEQGDCMKNVYRSDEWIKHWIKHKWNREIGKAGAYYVYNVDYDGIGKPVKKYVENKDIDILYERANGVMYYDFDNIGHDGVELLKKTFRSLSSKHKCFEWFETSWSGTGCHIRIRYDLKFKHRIEWQFVYMFYLDEIMRDAMHEFYTETGKDISCWFDDNTIDWTCATITRGFAIPYNETGVIESEYFEPYCMPYKTKHDLEVLIYAYTYDYWNKKIVEKFWHNIGHEHTEHRFKKDYVINCINMEKATQQEGERFNYNWRLKCVTTLMNIYEGDKDKVRDACKYIYSFIKPYKNHTYDEMINDELENKIFANGDMTYNASNDVIDDLNKYFGFDIKTQIKTNEVYVSEILQTL